MISSSHMSRLIWWMVVLTALAASLPASLAEEGASRRASSLPEVSPLPIEGVLTMPQWSPDGEWIAASGPHYQGIYVFRPDGRDFRRLTDELGAGLGFAWSPDSKMIAYRAKRLANAPASGPSRQSSTGNEAAKHSEGTSSNQRGRSTDSSGSDQIGGATPAETVHAEEGKKPVATRPAEDSRPGQPMPKLVLSIKVLPLAGAPPRTIIESQGDVGFPAWVSDASLSVSAEGQASIFGLDGKVIKRGVRTNASILAWASNMARVILADHVEGDRVVIISDNGDRQYLTDEKDGRFYEPVVSPRGDHVLVHSLLDDHLHVINLADRRRRDLGVGLGGRWSPEGKRIACYVARDDGHNITDSDIYLIDLSDGGSANVTNSPDRLEMHPCWSPNGRFIACDDAKTGSIFVYHVDLQDRR